MKCKVKIRLKQVECPGTLHLRTRLPVYISVCLFGQVKRSDDVYPSFPMTFGSSILFQRFFTNAKNPDHVMEILEDETITIELKQYTKDGRDCQTLAHVEEPARKFLFPSKSYVSKDDGLLREVLLHKTAFLSDSKILDPKLIFSSSTTFEDPAFEVTPKSTKHRKDILVPARDQLGNQDVSYQTPNAKEFRNPFFKCYSNPEYKSNYLREELRRSTEFNLEHPGNKKPSRHCICECPCLKENSFSLKTWLNLLKMNSKERNHFVKPFRTGKAPETLISARQFKTPEKKEKHKQALCEYCSVPSKKCTLCNAYKTVYGSDNFLLHRFKNYENTLGNTQKCKAENDHSRPQTPRIFQPNSYDSFPEGKYRNKNAKVNFSPVQTTYSYATLFDSSSDEDPIRVVNKTRSKYFSRSYDNGYDPGITASYLDAKHFDKKRSSRRNQEGPLGAYDPFTDTSAIRNRIKELMQKNKSVLEYGLSSSASSCSSFSSSSPTSLDDEWNDEDSSNEKPTKSVVKPCQNSRWYHQKELIDGTHRENFDASLNAIYQDLYKKTLAI